MDPSKEKQSAFDMLSREEQISFNLQEIELIIDELDDKGIDVENFPDELLKDKELWLSCTPTIKEWIFKAESPDIFTMMIRLLAIPPLRKTSTAKEIIGEFYRPGISIGTRWTIGNTMSVIANDEVLEEILKIINDEENGETREMFVAALGNLKDPKVVPYLMGLLSHPQLDGYAIMALNKLRAIETVEDIRNQLENPREWVQVEARKTMRKFEKIIEKQAEKEVKK